MTIETIHRKFPGEGESIEIVAHDIFGIAGTITLSQWDKPVPFLFEVFVAEDHRRRGIGRRMLTTAIAMAREAGKESVTLWVRRENEPAMKLYRSLGFFPAGNDDPVFMVKPLAGVAATAAKV